MRWILWTRLTPRQSGQECRQRCRIQRMWRHTWPLRIELCYVKFRERGVHSCALMCTLVHSGARCEANTGSPRQSLRHRGARVARTTESWSTRRGGRPVLPGPKLIEVLTFKHIQNIKNIKRAKISEVSEISEISEISQISESENKQSFRPDLASKRFADTQGPFRFGLRVRECQGLRTFRLGFLGIDGLRLGKCPEALSSCWEAFVHSAGRITVFFLVLFVYSECGRFREQHFQEAVGSWS